jgi:hypothetical protein
MLLGFSNLLGTVESPKLLQELFNLDTKPDFHSALAAFSAYVITYLNNLEI